MATSFKQDALGYFILKDPDANLDYQLNWADTGPLGSWLGADTIVSTIWTVDAGLIKGTDTFTPTTATIWLSGGVAGTTYNVSVIITTAAGRTDERSFRIICQQR